MTYRLRYHPSVAGDLETISDLIEDYAGAQVAHSKLTEIAKAAQGLRRLPHIGTQRDHILPGLRAIPAARRAVIAFIVDDDTCEVHVLAITYGGADWIGRAGARRN